MVVLLSPVIDFEMSSLRVFDVIIILLVGCYTSRSPRVDNESVMVRSPTSGHANSPNDGNQCKGMSKNQLWTRILGRVNLCCDLEATLKHTLSPCRYNCNAECDVYLENTFSALLPVSFIAPSHPAAAVTSTTTVRHVRWQSRTTPPNMTHSRLRSHGPPFYNPLREVRYHERNKLRRLGRLIRGLRRRHRRRGEVSDLEIPLVVCKTQYWIFYLCICS